MVSERIAGTALFDAVGRYLLDGEVCELEMLKGAKLDERIPIKLNSTDRPETVLGKAEARFLGHVYKMLTGEYLPTGPEIDSAKPQSITPAELLDRAAKYLDRRMSGRKAANELDDLGRECKAAISINRGDCTDDDVMAVCEFVDKAIEKAKGELK